MIEGISAVTLGTHEMSQAVRFYCALGFEVLHGDEQSSFASFRAVKLRLSPRLAEAFSCEGGEGLRGSCTDRHGWPGAGLFFHCCKHVKASVMIERYSGCPFRQEVSGANDKIRKVGSYKKWAGSAG
jgi:catechol 2,3-dioxygenase-like lactoylglutathione lyase family enzyme